MNRREFVVISAAATVASAQKKRIPVGLELFSVRAELKQDLMGTVREVAKMGYDGVEFFSPYYDWTDAQAKEMRKLLDEVGMRCFSTHNSARAFAPEGVSRAIELNGILGSKFIVMASAGKVADLDGWKQVAERLNQGAQKMKAAGIRAGFHNHQAEFRPIDGTRPMEVLARDTTKDVVLQLDVGTAIEAGTDPVAWINQNPGRIASIHCKEWSRDPAVGYKALMGEGAADWKKIFQAAERKGGLEYYLVEQEGSRFPAMETAKRSLELFKKLHG